ncbi:MAG TPA: GtrA family protein [Phycicoccus sp.]|nr:GtrA family protein [Phycicoccus sp.]
MSRSAASRAGATGRLLVFGVVGATTTVVHLGGFVVLRYLLDAPQPANGAALVVAAMTNTWANRRWTFGVRGREGAARHQVQGLLVLGLTLAMTSGGLWLLDALSPAAPTWAETAVIAVTTALATAVKFLAMLWWVFPDPTVPAQNSATTKLPTESSKRTAPVHS